MKRSLVLPSSGQLLVSTDLHGNLRDWRRLREIFEASDAQWLLLGDLVHGPGIDDSPTLIDELFELRARFPERVHFVLGNHDAGHIGFRRTSKFHDDEVAHLEARLTSEQLQRMKSLFSEALLAAIAPCGLFFAHGSPGDALTSLELLDGDLPPMTKERAEAIGETLWCYGQRGEVTARLLERLGGDLRVVVHGHDRDESGWFTEGGNQVQAVIFGAPDENKRYLMLDLSARYENVDDVHACVRRLY